MKERTPLCHCRAQRRYVCLRTGCRGVQFRAAEPAQDPSSRADDVLHWVGPGAPAALRPLDPGASCLPAGKVRKHPMMGQVNHEPLRRRCRCSALWDQQKSLKHPTVFFPLSIFLLFHLPHSLLLTWTLVIKEINLSPTSAERVKC